MDYDYVHPVDRHLECAICRSALENPVMSKGCEHCFCRGCIMQALDTCEQCPIDRTPLEKAQLVSAPRAIRSMVDELQVYCPRREYGCSHKCERQHVVRHLQSCRVEKTLQQMHAAGGGEAEICDTCGDVLGETSGAQHDSVCPDAHVACVHAVHGCGWTGARAQLSTHLTIECQLEPIKDFLHVYERTQTDMHAEMMDLHRRLAYVDARMAYLVGRLDEWGGTGDKRMTGDTGDRRVTGDTVHDGTVHNSHDTVHHDTVYDGIRAASPHRLEMQDVKLGLVESEMSAMQTQVHTLYEHIQNIHVELSHVQSVPSARSVATPFSFDYNMRRTLERPRSIGGESHSSGDSGLLPTSASTSEHDVRGKL